MANCRKILYVMSADEPFVETFEWHEPLKFNCTHLVQAPCYVAICRECGFHYATLETRDPRQRWYIPTSGLCAVHAKSRAFFGYPYRMLPLFTYYPDTLERMLLLPDDFLVREFLFLMEDYDREQNALDRTQAAWHSLAN